MKIFNNLKSAILARILLPAIALAFSAHTAFALPGVVSYIPDVSGEYVYYRDNTFSGEAIVGVLYYNESTYALRFYSPATKEEAEKDITIYVTVNPENVHLELTGEKIMGAYAEEDADIINYLHDILYEFTARRQKVLMEGLEDTVQTQEQDWEQFGGKVKVTFNAQIPIFNIEAIASSSGKKLLSVETIGKIISNQDTSFSGYKGITSIPQDKKRSFKSDKKASKKTINFESAQFEIVDEWTEFPGYWFLGDYAMLTCAIIPAQENLSASEFECYFEKMSCQSTQNSYTLWNQRIKKIEKSGKIVLTNLFYQPETGDVTRDIKVLIQNGDTFAYLKLTVFDSVYKANKRYFDDLIASFTTTK